MKKNKTKKLLATHKLLIREKNLRIQEVLNVLQTKRTAHALVMNLIKEELGVPKEELDQWIFSQNGQTIEQSNQNPDGEKKDAQHE